MVCSVAMSVLTLLAMKPPCGGMWAHPRPGEPGTSVHVQRTDGFSEGDAADGFREQLGDAELADPAAPLRALRQRDGVGHHQLVELRFLEVVDRRARQHRVRAVGDDL